MSTARLLDYGVGNLHSLRKALERSGLAVEVTPTAEGPGDADALVLPGVGAFAPAASALAPAREAIVEAVEAGTPLLGVCLGLQLLAEGSEEGPGQGLGLLPGRSITLAAPRLPHIGWNTLEGPHEGPLAALDGQYVYYVHTYGLAPGTPGTVATTTYGNTFSAIVHADNVMAAQFHPEKSSAAGRIVLDAFAALVEGRA